MEHHIGALHRTPFPASRDFPSRGNERYEGKNSESYTSGTISAFSPFGGWRHHLARWEACHWIRGSRGSPMNPVPLPPPTSWGHYKAPLCCELLMKGLLFRALFCPRLRGKSGEAGKGEASAASQSAELFFMPYDIESQSRNADFISIARRAIHHPQRRRRCRPLSEAIHNPPPTGGHNLRPGGPSTFPFTTLLHNPRRQPRPFFIKLAAKPPPQSSA